MALEIQIDVDPGPSRTTRTVDTVVARAFGVRAASLQNGLRGSARVAFARQVAMYLAHTQLGLSYAAAGARFGRDRTTASHACRVVEERREDPFIDSTIDLLKRAVGDCLCTVNIDAIARR